MKKTYFTKCLLLCFLMISAIFFGCATKDNSYFDIPESQVNNANNNSVQKQKHLNQEYNDVDQKRGFNEEMMQNMISTCDEKTEGDTCTVKGIRGEMQGTCTQQQENLVCLMQKPEMPKDHREGFPGGPDRFPDQRGI